MIIKFEFKNKETLIFDSNNLNKMNYIYNSSKTLKTFKLELSKDLLTIIQLQEKIENIESEINKIFIDDISILTVNYDLYNSTILNNLSSVGCITNYESDKNEYLNIEIYIRRI